MDYKKVIESRYNREAWQLLLHDIFHNKVSFWNRPSEVRVSSRLAKQALNLGKISLSDGESIAVYEVELNDNVDIERNRRGIRDMLTSDWRNMGYAGAFMFCYRKDESVLRFSYVSESWSFAEDGTYKKDSTDTKRFTYLLGEGHRSRTAIQQFEGLKKSSLTLQDLTKAFSVDAVSDMFFHEYKQQYEDIIAFITGKRMVKVSNKWEERVVGEPNEKIFSEFMSFSNPEKAIRDYVKKLMGRIVFLQFLQKKGWLGVPMKAKWGEGDKEFIQNLFINTQDKNHFIDNVLEFLFNDINTERAGDLVSPEVGKDIRVPYLNGGLFEPDAADATEFPLPAKYMKSMLDFFSSYNFTIDENDPDDAEMGVDPEMLGRIFENLLEDNKDKGAFYTPKEIVTYMCRESLIAYLQTDIEKEEQKEAIRQFVTNHQFVQHLPGDTLEMLKNVKICDPAIGSGAFPMGLLKELFLCRGALEGFDQKKSAEIKKHIIQQNIYGVDIEKGAVDIARLRFWLSLIVDEETPETLPNLDFKIMQGNSLLEQYKGIDLSTMTEKKVSAGGSLTIFDSMLDVYRKELRDKLALYYNCPDHNKKKELRKDIVDIVKKELYEQGIDVDFGNLDLAGNDQFFLWHTWFHDVFSRPSKEGFDIVIGNPPYGAKYDNQTKRYYKNTYITANSIRGLQKASLDTYTLFIELGYNLLRKDGSFAYIVPISLTSSDSLTGVHRLLMGNCETIHISSYAVRPKPVFENAVVNTSILLFQKTGTACKHLYSTKMHRRGNEFDLQKLIDNLQFVDVKGNTLYGRIPKIGLEIEKTILNKLFKQTKLGSFIKTSGSPIIYRFAGGRYFKVVTNYSNGSSAERTIYFANKKIADAVGCILSSNLSFWFYQIFSDNLNWKTYEIENFTIPQLSTENIGYLDKLYSRYLADIEAKANIRTTSGESTYNVDSFKEYKIVHSKTIIDEIDDYICPLYGLTQEECDYIKNYELEFRLAGE